MSDFFALIRRRKWLIMTVMLLTTGIALFASSRQTPVYESEARIVVLPTQEFGGGAITQSDPNLATEAELMYSIAVSRIVARDLGLEITPANTAALLDDLGVEVLEGTEILQITYRLTDPTSARARAQAFAEGYLQYRRGTAANEMQGAAEDLDRELGKLRRRFEEIERQLKAIASEADPTVPTTTPPQVATLRTEAALIQDEILQRQLARLDLADTSITAGEVVQPASLPTSPVSPNHGLNGGIGLAAGIGLGVALALLRDRLSERLRSPEEIEDRLLAPVLGLIPHVGGWRKRKKPLLVSLEQRRSPAAESYRTLRTNVLSAASLNGAKTFVVTSMHPGEGKTATVANLAVAIARAGKRVTLVSADLRRPRVHEFFAVDQRYGLADVLEGRMALDAVSVNMSLPTSSWVGKADHHLSLVPSGRVPSDKELLTAEAMGRIVADLEAVSDIVLIDAPPIVSVADALVVASVADGVLMVIGPAGITGSNAMTVRQRLDRVGAHLLGVVLNGQGPTTAVTDYEQ